jgi:hypothetical protein
MTRDHFRRAYTLVLSLYPGDHRVLFECEMRVVFAQRLADCAPGRLGCFVCSELNSIIKDATAAWIDKLRHILHHLDVPPNCGCIPDFRKIRPPWTNAKAFYAALRAPVKPD